MLPTKYTVVCLALILAVLFLAERTYHVLTSPLEMPLDQGRSQGETNPGNPPAAEQPKQQPAPAASPSAIASRNIFSPERKDFASVAPGTSTNPVVRPQVILYGVTIAGNYRSASVDNPGRPLRRGEREQMTIKLGERIGEYRLAKVLSDRIMLKAGEDSFEVFLYDPGAPKKRVEVRTETKPAPIVTAQVSSPPTSDVRTGDGAPRNSDILPSPSSSTRVVPKETSGETRGSSQQQPSTQATTPLTQPDTTASPGTVPTVTQIPVPMNPTQETAPSRPSPLPVPPDMGKPISLPPGGSGTPGK